MEKSLQMNFDYDTLDTETRIVVQQRTSEIKTLMRRSAQDIIDIGKKLIEVKARLGHGHFGGWLESEFQWKERTAQNFMMVTEQFKSANFADLSIAPSALYLLAAPSTPEPARTEAIERAQSGEPITHSAAKTIIGEYKPLKEAPPITSDTSYYAPAEEYKQSAEADDGYDWAANPEPVLSTAESIPHIARNSGNNEWYTPAEYIEAARAVLGNIDLDPASSDTANEIVKATKYYTSETDGLARNWRGNVWMNPPYSAELISRFCSKLAHHYLAGDVIQAVVLVNNATETAWFNELVSVASAIVFPRSRVRFWKSDGELGAPLQGQAVIYAGEKPADFLREFLGFGWGVYVG